MSAAAHTALQKALRQEWPNACRTREAVSRAVAKLLAGESATVGWVADSVLVRMCAVALGAA